MTARSPSGGASLRRALLLAVALLAAACSALPQEPGAASASAPASKSRVDLLLGYRWHDDALPDVPAFEELDEAVAFGADVVYEPESWLVGLELGLQLGYAEDDALADIPGFGLADLDLELSTSELYLGVVKTFRLGERLLPYVGAGLSLVAVEGELSSTVLGGSDTEDDFSPAGYLHGGLLIEAGKSFHVGIDGRAVLGTDLDLDGLEVDADYLQLAIVLGWRF